MPYYDFCCNTCGETSPHFRKVEQRNVPQYCCGAEAVRVISAPALRVEISSYVSPASGRVINSRVQQRDDLAREDCVLNEPGFKSDIARHAAVLKERNLVKIDASVDKMAAAMHSSNLI